MAMKVKLNFIPAMFSTIRLIVKAVSAVPMAMMTQNSHLIAMYWTV